MLTSKGIGNLFKVILLVGLSLLFMTCDPGLGKAVDTQAPKVSVAFPATKSVLKSGFIMKGVASDEIKVVGCKVTFKNIKTSQVYEFPANVSDGEFSVNINTPKPDGTFELPDGDYNVTVTVSDAYRNSTADVVYTIDNTSPTVLLTSPNVYVESNWPSMYKVFTIKGEVYDFTTISEVKVYIVDSEGTIITETVAEGTNTFLANFDSPNIPTGKTCYYYAVAKDAGGNENTYCYHKQDIYALISQQQKNSTFPSINAIGYVDQKVSENFNGTVTNQLLGTKKIENKKPGATKGSRPGFDFFDKDTAQIKWMNISEEKLAGIGIGTPVLGTIMPPTDGSAVLDVEVWIVKGTEISKDEYYFPEYSDENKIETCWLSTDDENFIEKQGKLSMVGDSVNFQIDSHEVGSSEEWPSAIYKIKVKYKTNSEMEGFAECRFQVTSGAPKLTEGNFSQNQNASYYRGFMTAETLSAGKNFLKGISKTSDEESAVPLTYEIAGSGSAYEVEVDESGHYKIDIPIDVVNHSKDGEYTYTLTSSLESGNLSTVISRIIVIDTTNPTVDFTTITDGDIVGYSDFNLKGNIEDTNGISLVEYQLLEGDKKILIDGTQTDGWQPIPKAKSSFNLTLSNLKENVTYTVKIRATDMAGNRSEDENYKCSFTIDLAEPVATIDSPAPEADSSIVFTNQIPTFSGKAIDNEVTAGKLAKTAELSFRKDGGATIKVTAGTSEGQFNWNTNSGEWTWVPTSSQFNGTGKYDVTLKVTDTAEKSISVTRTVSLDNSVPTIKLTQVSSYVERKNPEDGYYVNGEISVKFDITENDYIKDIKWYKPNGSVDSQNLGTNAQPTVVIKTTDFDDGTKLGEFKLVVTDRSGNEGVYTGEGLLNYEINQDSDKPTIEISGINENITTVDGISKDDNLFSTGDSLSLTFKDDDGVASAKYRIDSASEKTINGGNVKVKTDNISLNGLTQGSHTIKVTVTDTNGNTISTNTIYFGIDDKSPELTINGLKTDIDAGHILDDVLVIKGTVKDTYQLDKLVYCYTDTPDEITPITPNGENWTLSIPKQVSENRTIEFTATDKFQKETKLKYSYKFDLDKPNLEIVSAELEGKVFNQVNSFIYISATVDDGEDGNTRSGVKYVYYGFGAAQATSPSNWESPVIVSGEKVDKTEVDKTVTIPTYDDGNYRLFVKAVDNCGNESEVQKFNITTDSTAPVLTVGGSSDASGTSYASGSLNLSGTVVDANLESLTYTYTLNGTDIDKNVDITPPDSGSNWSISKGDLGNGTHIFKIFAVDKAGNLSSLTRNIIVDTEDPVITTNVSPLIMYNNGNGEEETVNGTINVNVRVSETNKLKGVYYTLTESDRLDDAADWSSKASFKDTELATGKTITIDTTDYVDGTKLPLRIKAVDEAGNYSVVEVKPVVNQASDKPTFTPSNFDNENMAGWSNGAPKNVFGDSSPNMIFTIADDDSVKECWVKVDTGDFKKLDKVVTSTQQIVTYPVKELGYGPHTITFKVIDTNCSGIDSAPSNNYVEKTYYIANDKEAPKIELTNTNGQFVGEQFTLSGKVTDENGIKSVILSSEDGNTTYATLTPGSGFDVDVKFSHDFQLAQLDKKSIRVIAVDGIGNQSETIFTYVVDATAPTVSFGELVNNYINNDYPTLNVEGTAKDEEGAEDTGVSKLSKVLLKIGGVPTGIDDAECITANGIIDSDGSMNWSSSLNFSGKTAGEYYIYAQAFDIAGNKSDVASIKVYVDSDTPLIDHSYKVKENDVGVFKDSFTISGSVSDNSGIKSVTAKIQGASNNLGVKPYATGVKEGDWSFSVPKSTGEGKITILVTAEDICGKTTTETLTATLDVGLPEITFTDIDDDSTGIKTSKTTETPRVSISYSDITSGINNINYTFWYYDRAQGNFVNKKEGNFVPTNPFSGSFVIQMAESMGGFISKETSTDGEWYVELAAKDNAGNSINQNSPHFYVDLNRPTLSVTSPLNTETLKKMYDPLTVTGSTLDENGGEIDRVVVKIRHGDYGSSQTSKFTKTFTVDGRDGSEKLTENGSSYDFTVTWGSGENNSPFIYPDKYEILVTSFDKAGNEREYSHNIACDLTPPTITFSRPYSYAVNQDGNITSGSIVYSPMGETNISALVYDSNGNNAIYYQVGGTVSYSTDTGVYDIGTSGALTGTDSHGIQEIDTAHKNYIKGNWYKLSHNASLDLTYNTQSFWDNKVTYHVSDDPENIATLDIHVIAVDLAGNINYCKMPLKIDTDTDKPNLLLLSPKIDNENNANVGGVATVSGTVSDNNAVHSVLMQVELVNGNYVDNVLKGNGNSTFGINYSTNGYEITNPQVLVENIDGTYSFENTPSYFSDKSKWYKVKLGEEGATSTTWNMAVNKNKEFDNGSLHTNGFLKSTVAQTELIIRVRALDTKPKNKDESVVPVGGISDNAKLGEYREFTLIIDSGSPSIDIKNIGDFPPEGSYIGGNLTFDVEFTDDEALTEYSIIAYSTASGSDSKYVIEEELNSSGLGNIKTVTKTVNTADIFAECGNVIQLKFYAKDKSSASSGELAAKESFITFKYIIDNDAPLAEKIQENNYLNTESADGGKTREDNGGHLRILTNEAPFIGKANDESNGSGVDYVMLYFTKENKLYNPSVKETHNTAKTLTNKISVTDENNIVKEISFPVASLKDVVKTKDANGGNSTPYIIIDKAEGGKDTDVNGDRDGYNENFKVNGEWYVYINSENLPDGLYDVNYVVVDQAKNARYYKDTMLVQNNAPTINSIILATDINADGTVTIGQEDIGYEHQKFTKFTGTNFTVRNNKLKVKVNVGGGNGTLTYYLQYQTEDGSAKTINNTTGEFYIDSASDFKDDSSTAVNYTVWVEDSVEQSISLSSGKSTIDMILDNEDKVSPVAQLFELNTDVETSVNSNEKRGSLYKANGSVQGYIEPRQNSLVDNVSQYIKDPEVSGTIILRGEVMDDQRIGSITLTLGNKTKQIAVWENNTLTAVNANGEYRSTLIVNELGLSGHYVEWSYVWDTWDITDNVGYNTPVKVTVTDSNNNSTTEKEYSTGTNAPRTESNKFDNETWGYNYITVDVVPYITKIETPNRTNSGLKKNNIRSASGKYSVIKGNISDFIKVYGFNLNASAARIVDSTEVNGTVSDSTGSAIAVKTPVSPYKELSLSNNSSVSGYLEIIVNGIRSINNINDNSQSYNKEPDESVKNTRLNDDRYLRFFDMKDTGIKNGFYPTMIMEGNDPVFGYIDLKGGPGNDNGIQGAIDNGGAGSYSGDHAMPQRAKFNGANASVIYKEYLIKASIWDQMGMARDESGRFHHVTLYNRADASMSYIYDRYAELYPNGKGWGTGTGYSNYDGNWSNNVNNNAITLESMDYGNGLQLGRYQYPKLIAKGNSRDAQATIYMMYFDANTTNKDLIFRNFRVGLSSAKDPNDTDSYIALYSGGSASDGKSYAQVSNCWDYNTDGRESIATNASNHFAFGVTSNNHVVVVYYDEFAGKLKLKYSNNSVIGINSNNSVPFTESSIVFPDYVGNYVSMAIDENNGIHISAFDAGNSDLAYFYIPRYNGSEMKHVTVDQASAVGNWTQIKLKDGVPYIAYYNATEAGGRESIKLAYANEPINSIGTVVAGVDDEGYATGGWEYMTVPSITPSQGGKTEFQNVCLDFNSAGNPVVGYLGDNLEFGTWCDE